MLTDKKQILQLVALLASHGVRDVVLCPGSRNAPIVHTISECGLFVCHAVTDERSAGFLALGLALASGTLTAVCVTSGSALLNVHPAVAEAFYQEVPLVVISADRPEAWIGQMDGQTMVQSGALGQVVLKSVSLPEVNTEEDEWYCNRLVNEALLATCHHGRGPVHINVPISEPLYRFDVPALPSVRKIERAGSREVNSFLHLIEPCHTAMILVGQMPPTSPLNAALLMQVQEKGYALLAEHLANLPNEVGAVNPSTVMWEQMPSVDFVVSLGGHLICKEMKSWLRKHPPLQHWHVSEDGRIADLFCCQTLAVESSAEAFLCEMNLPAVSPMQLPLKPSCQQPFLRPFFSRLPAGAVLHLANSSSVRWAQQFRLPEGVSVLCNRGINGIEGSVSAAVGYALATPDRPNFLLIGDLSFFYDQNGLWNNSLPRNLHILLVNNRGGQIFHTLPIPQSPQSRSLICANHTLEAKCVCEQFGIGYFVAEGQEAIEDVMPQFVSTTGKAVLLEIKC